MGIFAQTANIFLNTIQNPDPKINDIHESISILYDILLTGKLQLPILDYQYNELLYDVNLSLVNTITKYYETKYVNGDFLKIGYSPVKIATSVTGDPLFQMTEVGDIYQNTFLDLKQLYIRVNKDLNYHKYLSYAFNDLYNDFVSKCDLRKFLSYTNSFPYIFKKVPYNDKSQYYSAIPLIISSLLLIKSYQNAYDFPSNVIKLLYSDNRFSDLAVKNQFELYINKHQDEISLSITNFICNNILLFGDVTDNSIITYISNVIKEELPNFSKIFIEEYNTIGISDLGIILLSDINKNIISDTVLTNLHESFYFYLDDIWNIDSGAWDYFNMQEDMILANLVKYYNGNLSQVNDSLSVANQFANSQMFLLNSYILTYDAFISHALQDTQFEIFTIKHISAWLNRILTDNPNILNLINYIKNNPLKYDSYCSSFKLSYFLRFREIIIGLCDNPIFKEYIMSKFVKRIEKEINEHYYVKTQWSIEIDKLLTFIKSLFMKHLLEFEDNKPKIWSDYISDLNNIILNNIQNSVLKINEASLINLLKLEKNMSENYYFIFNSFFKSAFLSKYLEKRLLDRYSL